MSTFFKELKERKVIKAIISYAVVTFVIMQLVEILFPIFELPAWASKFVILLLLISFPIVLFISWTFDFSIDGIKHRYCADIPFAFKNLLKEKYLKIF